MPVPVPPTMNPTALQNFRTNIQKIAGNVWNAPSDAAQQVAQYHPSSQNPVIAAAQSTGNLAKNTLGNPNIWANAAGQAATMAVLNPLTQKLAHAPLQALEKGGGDINTSLGMDTSPSWGIDGSTINLSKMANPPLQSIRDSAGLNNDMVQNIGSVFQKIQGRTPLGSSDVDTLLSHPDVQQALGHMAQDGMGKTIINAANQGEWRGILTAAQPYLEKIGSSLTPLLKTTAGTNLLQ